MIQLSPDDPRPVHFMGVAGAGMSALALLALRRGLKVTGCDREPEGPGGSTSSADVRRAGGVVYAGHDPGHVEGTRAVVVTAAVPPDHPELERARALGIPIVRRADALAAAIAPGHVIAVAGTHGKTTTTAMTTEALAAAGLDPTGIAGGRVASWAGNTRIGGDAIFVVEADEYDKAFLALSAEVAVINNVEADHLECYGSVEALEDAFVEFARPARRVIAGGDDGGASRVAARSGRPTWTVGVAAQADVRIADVHQAPGETTARIRMPRGADANVRLKVPGLHNLRNAAAALAVTLEMGDVWSRRSKPWRPSRGSVGGSSEWVRRPGYWWWTITRTTRRRSSLRSRVLGRRTRDGAWWPYSSRTCTRGRQRRGLRWGGRWRPTSWW